MSFLLGNLSVPQIESRMGITLTEEERQFLISTRQSKASKIVGDKWHCFDIPFMMVCGNMDFATRVYKIFEPHKNEICELFQISIEQEGER